MKDFNIICAVALNGVIGDSVSNTIPWHLPADLQNFKRLTTGKTIVMGVNTFNSLGRKLPNRRHVVITRGNTKLDMEPDAMYGSFADVMRYEAAGFFVIGGEHIFGEALRYQPTNIHITLVNTESTGDVRFPMEGRRFKNDHFALGSLIYDEVERSEMMSEGGLDFQFTKFIKRVDVIRV